MRPGRAKWTRERFAHLSAIARREWKERSAHAIKAHITGAGVKAPAARAAAAGFPEGAVVASEEAAGAANGRGAVSGWRPVSAVAGCVVR